MLRAGKHVFCEKPLCLNEAELSELVSLYRELHSSSLIMVGFNRRFAPMAIRMKEFLSSIGEPLTMHYRVNAGPLPSDHWINDPEQGGGRIIGEVCHFIDLLAFLTGSQPVEVETRHAQACGGERVVECPQGRAEAVARTRLPGAGDGVGLVDAQRQGVARGGERVALDETRLTPRHAPFRRSMPPLPKIPRLMRDPRLPAGYDIPRLRLSSRGRVRVKS